MSMLTEAKLDILLAHHASLEAELLGQVNSENYVRITRELAELNPLIDAVKAYRATNAEIADIDALIADPATEPEMRGMAEAERETLAARSVELAQQIRVALLPKDAMDDRNVVLEIRAGPGADTPPLFAAARSGCLSVLPACRAGRSRVSPPAKAPWAASRKSSPRCVAAAHLQS